MRLCIDVSQAAYEGTGSGRYVVELVKELLSQAQDERYILFGSASGKKDSLERFLNQCKNLNSGVDTQLLPLPPRFFEIAWNTLHTLSIDTFVGDIDIYHSSDWTQAPSRALKITTVHDLIPFLFPEHVHPRILSAHTARWKWIKKECDAIIVDAEVTKRDIEERFKIPSEKIFVIPLACDQRFFDIGQKKLNLGEQLWAELDSVMAKYSLQRNGYILAVGTLEPRKNMKRLVEAYAQLDASIREKFPLVIVGKQAWAEELPKVDNVHLTGYVVDQDLPYLYAGAQCFIMPSLYEGFGLPVLEAMASGAPVICSDRSSLPEIGGDDVHYIQDPEDVDSIKIMLAHVLESDSKELHREAEIAFKRAQALSWERTAQETREVYKRLV